MDLYHQSQASLSIKSTLAFFRSFLRRRRPVIVVMYTTSIIMFIYLIIAPEMESDDESLESAITLESDPDFPPSSRLFYSCHVEAFTRFCHLLAAAVLWI